MKKRKRSRYGDYQNRLKRINALLSVISVTLDLGCADDDTIKQASRACSLMRTLRDRINNAVITKKACDEPNTTG